MELKTAVNTIINNSIQFDFIAEYLGTTLLVNDPVGNINIALSDVSNNQYETVFSYATGVEDIGLIEVFSINLNLYLYTIKGNGSIRFQFSGDGGDTWHSAVENDFDYAVPTAIFYSGPGKWLSSINVGDNQLQMRLQIKANIGTITDIALNRQINNIILNYRQKFK